MRGDGSIDEKERAFLAEFKAWLDVNGEGIFGSRPWKIYGEGVVKTANSGSFRDNEKLQESLSEKDIRFTQKNGTVYAYVLGFPTSDTVTIKALGRKSTQMNGKKIKKVRLLGCGQKIVFRQANDALYITMPDIKSTGKSICFAIM